MESEYNPEQDKVKKIGELKKILLELAENGNPIEVSTKIPTFARDFQKRNPDYSSYTLYHVITGSTPDPDKEYKFDTPDQELEKFITSIHKNTNG